MTLATAPLWTAAEAAAATGGQVTRDWAATGVSIDSRTLRPGDLFVALTDARDGHDFVAAALAAGAAAALVSRRPEGVAADAPLLIVPDVLAGLEALGRAGRARTSARVVAVTGSVGKTSTKDMLRVVLAALGRVHAAEASYNNHWGVPLTLARMPRDAAVAVVEIGMSNPGEIAPLARMARPHLGLITTIAPAHLAAFEDLAGIAREKADIFAGLEPGGIAVIPSDLDTSPILASAALAAGALLLRFGADPGADWRLGEVSLRGDTTIAHAEAAGAPILFKLRCPGRHFARNGLAVLAAATALGADPAIAIADLGRWSPPAGRGMRERILLDPLEPELSFDLIDDAYNANPVSLAAGLDVLAAQTPRNGLGRIDKGRRIAVLGDMLELGASEAAAHAAIARHPAIASIDVIHCAGPRLRAMWESLPHRQRGEWHETAAPLAARAHHLLDAGDIVLVKGSKGSRVSLVVDALRKLGQGRAPDPSDPDQPSEA